MAVVVAMAANSDGVEWSTIIKPFLSIENDINTKNEVIELCSAIIKSEEDILRNNELNQLFLNSFSLLSVDYINNNICQVPLNHIETVTSACGILLKHLVTYLISGDLANIDNIEHCLKAIKTLCQGVAFLSSTEFGNIVSTMKSVLPASNVENTPPATEKDSTNKQQTINKYRYLSVTIFEQLVLPIRDVKELNSTSNEQGNIAPLTLSESATVNTDPTADITKLILKANTESLQSIKAGDLLIDLCLRLPSIKKASAKIEDALSGKPFCIPTNHNEATTVRNSLHSTLADVMLTSTALRLPILEPLSPAKLEKLCKLNMSLLYCTVTQTTANAVLNIGSAISPKCSSVQSQAGGGGVVGSSGSGGGGGLKEDDMDATAVTLIEETLSLYTYIGQVIKSSTRAGGNIFQNHMLAGVWVLISGLQAHVASCTTCPVDRGPHLREDKGRSPSKTRTCDAPPAPPVVPTVVAVPTPVVAPTSATTTTTLGGVGGGGGSARSWLIKFQQSFGVLSVALIESALGLLTDLFDDLQLEMCEGAFSVTQVEPATISIMGQFTALERVARILTAAPINQLFFYIAIVSYRKACSLKRIRPSDGDTCSQSDSTTYFDDMIMCSDESSTEEDDDSEPILGLWFEETFAPPDAKDSKNSSITENPDVKMAQHDRLPSIVPEKGEAHGFIALATNIFVFLNKHFISTKSEYVIKYVKAGLAEQQVLILASIIKDLDRETARTEVVTISRYFGAALGQLYCDFSGALARFSHNLITNTSLAHLQVSLLGHLGVSPWNTEQPHGWPLQVYPRTLAILTQALSLRPQNEKEASVISIWHRVVNTLIDNVVNSQPSVEGEHEDLNVEHAQVLLYLFRMLNLMQKKSVVLLMAGGILRCSEIGRSTEVKELQILYLSRLLLLFDYIMKHLYHAPEELLEQIQWNLFYSTNLKTDSEKENNMTKLFTPWNDIEKNYRLLNVSDDFISMKPRFYVVTDVEINNQDAPKLDGLACNFILGTPDKLRYPLLLDALIEILNIVNFTNGNSASKLSFLGLCAVQYCFSICWRLLQLLPPSNSYFERLSTGENIPSGPMLLHSLVWGARAGHKTFARWLKDCLVKQGVYTQQTERLLKSASDMVNTLKYDVAAVKNTIIALTPDIKSGPMTKEKLPPLWHIILLDSLIAKLQLSLIDETETNTADTATGQLISGTTYINDILPNILKLAKAILYQARWSLLNNMVQGLSEPAGGGGGATPAPGGGGGGAGAASEGEGDGRVEAELEDVLAISSCENILTSSLAAELPGLLPRSVTYVLQGWNRSMLEECYMTPFLSDIIPSESYILRIVETHIATLTYENNFTVNFSLKRLLISLTKFICQHAPKIENPETKKIAINYLVQLTLDVRTEFLNETAAKTLDKMIGDADSEEHQKQVYIQVLQNTYRSITNYATKTTTDPPTVDEKILHNILKYYERLMDKPAGRQAMETFFTTTGPGSVVVDRDLVQVLMSVSSARMSAQYSGRILHFFNKLFQSAEKWPSDASLNQLCACMSRIARVESGELQLWLRHVILGGEEEGEEGGVVNGGSEGLVVDNENTKTDNTHPQPASSESNASSSISPAVPNTPAPTAATGGSTTTTPPVAPVTTIIVEEHSHQRSLAQENTQLLQSLTNFIVKQDSSKTTTTTTGSSNSEDVSLIILRALIELVTPHIVGPKLEAMGFTELMVVMQTLADAGQGRGHVYLFPAVAEWLEDCKRFLTEQSSGGESTTAGEMSEKSKIRLDAAACMMDYLTDVISGVQSQATVRAISPPWEGEMLLEQDMEWVEEVDNDDDSGEDSDEDSLCNKLCTFTVTQKEFMNQHWYNCHTCRMLDGVGVCSVCARVCHRGHDLSYAKYGNFFCDCGAKNDGTCMALVRRSPQQHNVESVPSTSNVGHVTPVVVPSMGGVTTLAALTAGLEGSGAPSAAASGLFLHNALLRGRRESSPAATAITGGNGNNLVTGLTTNLTTTATVEKYSGAASSKDRNVAGTRVKQFDGCRQWIMNYLGHSPIPGTLLELLQTLLPAVEVTCSRSSPVGCHSRAMTALQQLHEAEKRYPASELLMLPTLGSQEGAFENVRMNYTGEQGQTIRQLLSAHIVRRVAMCCTSSTHSRRQHLAVAHEKGKITILQLSALLKQADTSTRKLTLTRLSSAPIPFTVLTLTANHCNEDFLSVCGLKECHVLTFNSTGTVVDHLVLHPQLETGNFIIKSLWLPGSQTCLALITADFVKIYDLAKDALSPQYYFIVPSGKIRDCTFMYEDGVYNILLMSSPGHIYTEALNEESSAKHGSFYVTNTLEVFHLDVTDVNGQVAGGGVSIYYSHTLGLLFYSYAHGKSFISPLSHKSNCLTVVFPITLPSTAKNNGGKVPTPQSLCQWMEIPNHPGLICCAMQSSNNPVVLMLKPDTIAIQEIKIVQSKAKIMDIVAIRHNSGGDQRTTLILLCEDGSLKIYMANMEHTGFWMSPNMQPSITASSVMKPRKKKSAKVKTSSLVTLPVDFFEHCQAMNDVDIGGNDLLQIYNSAQVKTRLNTNGLYVACTRALGFTVDITSAENNMVMCGIRIQVGGQDAQRAPSFIEIFGRAVTVSVTRSRWYDIPFTREESLQADKKFSIIFGPSQDPDSITMVDCIKIFGKTKDAFGWPEEIEETLQTGTSLQSTSTANGLNDLEQVTSTQAISLSKIEKLVTGILGVLDGALLLYGNEEKLAAYKGSCISIATQLLTLPIPPTLQMHSTELLCSLHASKQQYHAYKDQALLQHVLQSLSVMADVDNKVDAESYYRLVMIVRGIAAARPQNLVKFTDLQTSIQDVILDDPLDETATRSRSTPRPSSTTTTPLLLQLLDILWLLHARNPEKPALAPVVAPGLKHTEQVIFALVEIVHAYNSCDTYSNVTVAIYLQLLLCRDATIAFSAKHALGRVLRSRSGGGTGVGTSGGERRVWPSAFTPFTGRCNVRKKRVVVPSTTSKTSLNSDDDPTRPSTSRTTPAPPPPTDSSSPPTPTPTPPSTATLQHQAAVATAAAAAVAEPAIREAVEALALFHLHDGVAGGQDDNILLNPLEALLAGGGPAAAMAAGGGYQPMLDIPPDADDETMVEIAIALSLQEHEMGGGVEQAAPLMHQQMLANPLLSQVVGAGGHHQVPEAGHFSDTTASAGGSDDEGSTAATDGSTLRTSPAEQGGSVGSESGGSGVESITGDHNVSGRSSAYGDNIQETISLVARSENASAITNYQACETETVQPENETDSESSGRLHILRLQLLEKMIEYLPKVRNISGVRSIPFFQVILQLTTDLDGNSERDKMCLNLLLAAIISELELVKPDFKGMCIRSDQREVQLVILRLLSILMSRFKASSGSKTDHYMFVSTTTATVLHRTKFIPYCLHLLQALLAHWNETSSDDSNAAQVGGNLLKEYQTQSPPDMSPFYLRQFVKGHAADIFQTFNQLLMEVALRLPYQVHRQTEYQVPPQETFKDEWYTVLCEYMMTSQTACVRRQVRKLLLFITGGKEQYRQTRDIHAIQAHIKAVKSYCSKGGFDATFPYQHYISLPYDTLVEMVEHLKSCLEIALNRVGNWQKFCIENKDIIPLLFQVSCLLDEGVAPSILQLLNCAVVSSASSNTRKNDASKPMARKDREKSDDSTADASFDESTCVQLVDCINKNVTSDNLLRFIKTFILETNTTTVRWQAHSLILAMYQNSNLKQQECLLQLLWKLWPLLPTYGRKAAQYVDLLGYFSLKLSQNSNSKILISDFVDKAMDVLHVQNELIAHHPNANLYTHMGQYVDLDGYYLESEPCLVCNNPEVPLSTIKLNSIKVDSKYTTTTQIMKLISSHNISRITIRIADLKRTKMVRCVNIYYNNRTVQAIVELKNKPALWHKAKKVTLPSGQTEVKIEFPLPIVACNLMVEYSDFYENIQASTETHQCPRCSAAVPANPGVCSNCGENVFQCHKCRAINYDEKDPFLCHSCGFCKYAKFDFTLLAKPCCAVEPIDSDEDRKKMVSSINTSLEKADRVYKQLMANKPSLESLVLKVTDHHADRKTDEPVNPVAPTAASVVSNAAPAGNLVKINKTIQILAQQYGNECKSSFEELSKIIQKVLVSRKELITYDRRHTGITTTVLPTEEIVEDYSRSNVSNCYGCSSAATEHCLTLLRALALNPTMREVLCTKGLIYELMTKNLRKGSLQIQDDVRHLLCILSRGNTAATIEICNLITSRVANSLVSDAGDLRIRHEIALLAALQQIHDNCWEVRLRFLVRLFLRACEDCRSPVIIEAIVLPCLQMWYTLCSVTMAVGAGGVGGGGGTGTESKKAKDKANNSTVTTSTKQTVETSPVDLQHWLTSELAFDDWKSLQTVTTTVLEPQPKTKEEMRALYLCEKYGKRWREKTHPSPTQFMMDMCEASWVQTIMFNQSSRLARLVVCNILEQCCTNFERKKKILRILTNYLTSLTAAGEASAEFLFLYQSLIVEPGWKQYLTVHGVLAVLADLITAEIARLHNIELRDTLHTAVSSPSTTNTTSMAMLTVCGNTSGVAHLTQGYALSRLTDLLASFLVNGAVRRQHKGRLLGAVLNGYLALRRLVVQRTRLIDDTQEKLLELLEIMTTGNEEETKAYMSVCIDAVDRCSPHDYLTPVFIFERLCSIIHPEENDIGEFFLTLEKDAQQEDFLQGRMLGNPYSSVESGLGPLMRDVKNKICQDCELVALLEDDNGMELLVHNKIMSLDLPVKDVYKKVWLAEGGEVDSMRVVYRMRGLLGDATEEFVESLSNKIQAVVDNEEVYKMANVLAECNGLKIMLTRLGAIDNLSRAKPLLQVLLKLFRLSVKVVRVQEVLTQPELGAMGVFLRTLQLCLESEPPDSSQAAVTEQLLDIMETVLSRATSQSLAAFTAFAQTFGGPEYVQSLLTCTNHTSVRKNQGVLVHLTRVLAALVYGSAEKTKILLDHFRPVFDFHQYDYQQNYEVQQKLEMFCVLTNGIERNDIGNTLKDDIISLGLVREALEYIGMHAPCVKPTLLRTDSDELKEFITKPALKYILRILTGLAYSHQNTQLAISSADTIPIIHRLEQVSSDEHVGSLAENLLEALRTNQEVSTKIEEVREFTRSEKKRLAMAMREKQLGQLGMRTNDKGQVTAKSTILQQMEELGEETGLVCCICREGYKYQPTKVLAIYTFTKRCNVDEFESKPRKTVGYSTVTHFNIVHVDCHMSAVRLARARDEWESAALQNANTKCNGLLPLWGPQVAESAFASCLARHNTYLQESTGHRGDIGHASTVHDLKLLMWRFATERSFHEDTGGGGPQSNLHMVPYLVHMALYVINTTRVSKKEDTNLTTYLNLTATDKCIESAFEADSPLYWTTLTLLLHSPQRWSQHRLAHLRRLLIIAHARACCTPPTAGTGNILVKSFTAGGSIVTDGGGSMTSVRSYSVYKPYLVFYALVDGIYSGFFKGVNGSNGEEQWPSSLADYIRHNDENMLKASEKLLEYYTEEVMPCTSFAEFCDVAGLLDVISDPDKYLSDLLLEV